MRRPDWLTARPIAHRGFHDSDAGYVENTLPAAQAAIDRDYAIEVDVQLTADGRVVVCHDLTLDRLTDSQGDIGKLSLSTIKEARFRNSDARIPTLDELLDLISGQTPLFIELKSDWQANGHLVQAVAEILSAYDGAVALMSFDHQQMAKVRNLMPGVARGLVSGHAAPTHWPSSFPSWRWLLHRHLVYAATSRPNFITYRVHALPASAPLSLRHFLRLPLLAFTVNTAEERAIAADYADQVIFEGYDPDTTTPATGSV